MYWIYNLPTYLAFTLFVFLVVIVSGIGLFLFKRIDIDWAKCEQHNSIVAILIGAMSVFLGVLMSLLIVGAAETYNKAQLDAQKEAQSVFVLFEIISSLPDTKNIQVLIIAYLEYIINVEYKALQNKEVPPLGGELITQIQNAIYNYEPTTENDRILYNRAVVIVDLIINFRIDRINIATSSVDNILWLTTVINCILLIIMSWFLSCFKLFHYLVTIVIAFYVASGFFVSLILSNPFQGEQGLTPEPFQSVLDNIRR